MLDCWINMRLRTHTRHSFLSQTASRRPHVCRTASVFRARQWKLSRAAQGDSEASAETMSLQEAYAELGVREGASFEDCLKAKNKLLAGFQGDKQKCLQVERAYDRVFNQQLSARLRGEISVSSKVRYADVPTQRPAPKKKVQQAPKAFFQNLPGGGIVVGPPRDNDLVVQGAVFGVLATWVLLQDWFTPATMGASDIPTFQLALGAAAAVYFLREQKRTTLRKALLLAVAGLVAGALLGSGVENWLRVDIVPLGGIDAPGTIVAEFALAGLCAVSILLA